MLRSFILVGSIAWLGCRTVSVPNHAKTHPEISQSDLRLRLSIIADDSMLGRSTLGGGNAWVEKYLGAEAARIGLEPGGENGTYFQTFGIRARSLDSASHLIVDDAVLRPVTDFKVFPFGRGDVRPVQGAQAIFGGIVGDSATQINSDQAANRLVVLGVPDDMTATRVYRNVIYGPSSRFRDAVAVAIASFDYLPEGERAITSSISLADATGVPANAQPTSILVSRRSAQLMLGQDIDRARPGTLGRIVSGRLVVNEVIRPTRNVIGILAGSDSALRRQYVALGAHHDHLGISTLVLDHDSVRAHGLERVRRRLVGGETLDPIIVNVDSLRRLRIGRADSTYNGADDDGSGSVSLLEIAEQFAATESRLKRSLLFVWHAAEESGLIGSAWFTDHPTVPLDSIVAQLNLDMVGRGGVGDVTGGGPDYLQVIGASRRSPALDSVVESVNQLSGHRFTLVKSDPHGSFCRSDHWSYARFGIPIAFFTTGPHADYHQVTDEAQYVDYAKLGRVTQFVSEVARSLANSGERFEPPGARPQVAAFCPG